MGRTPTADAAHRTLAQYADELVDGLRQLVPAALTSFDEAAIHKSRVATRRLKAVVDLVGPVVSSQHRKPFNRAARNLRRRLGPLRDMDVMIRHLDDLAGAQRGRHAAAVAWIRQRLVDQRNRERERSRSRASASRVLGKLGTWWGLRQELEEAAEAVPALLTESLHRQLGAFAEQADRLARRPTSTAASSPTSQDPHELRIASKALRYTLEMARETGHPLPARVTKTFRRMQDLLGLWHDHVVLGQTAIRESLDADLALHDVMLQRQVLVLTQYVLGRADHELRKFTLLWLKCGQSLSNQIHDTFPLTTPVGEAVDEKPGVSSSVAGERNDAGEANRTC